MGNTMSESEENNQLTSSAYVYDEKLGWININLFLRKIEIDIKAIEHRLFGKQKNIC